VVAGRLTISGQASRHMLAAIPRQKRQDYQTGYQQDFESRRFGCRMLAW